jgi:hypothetical protein
LEDSLQHPEILSTLPKDRVALLSLTPGIQPNMLNTNYNLSITLIIINNLDYVNDFRN